VLDSGELNITPLALERAGEQQVRCLASPKNLVGCWTPLIQRLRGARGRRAGSPRDHIHNVDSDIADDLVKVATKELVPAPAIARAGLAGNRRPQ